MTVQAQADVRTAPVVAKRSHGFMSEAGKVILIWRKDLAIEWRNVDNLPAMFFFSMLTLVIFNFGFDFFNADFRDLGPGVLWVAFCFSGVLAFGHSFAIEREGDCIFGLMLAPVDPGTIYLGKLLANCTSMMIVEAAVLPLCSLMFNHDMTGQIGPLALVLLVHTIGFASTGTLFGAMTARTRRGDVLLPILLFSLSVPLMISAVKCTGAALAGESLFAGAASAWLVMASIFDAVFVAAAFLTFEYVIEE